MWWIVLSLIIAFIFLLLWWRNLQERSWQREMAYLTRHENHDGLNSNPTNLQSTISESVTVQPKNADQAEDKQEDSDNRVFSAQENQHYPTDQPDTNQDNHQQYFDLTDGTRTVISPIADKKIEPQITVTESAPIPEKKPKELISATPSLSSSIEPNNKQSDDISPLPKRDIIDPEKAGLVQQTNVVMDNNDFALVVAKEVSEVTQTDTEKQTSSIPLQRTLNCTSTNSAKVNEDLSVISLEEATRKITAHTLTETEESNEPEQLEVIQFNWRQKQIATQGARSKRRVNEIRPDDPILNKIRSQTKAEQETLLKVRALKNYNLDELEQATQHSLGQAVALPSHLTNSAPISPSMSIEHNQDKQIIDEEDIRLNLLRQRLARLRQQNNSRSVDSIYSAHVIAEEEVFYNLAKTDSPINKQRYKRPMVRESVIPAAARISDQHTVQMNVPVTDISAEKEMNNIILDRHIPLSTRFTPFHLAAEDDTNMVKPPQIENDYHSENKTETAQTRSVTSIRMDKSLASQTFNPAKIHPNQSVSSSKNIQPTTDQVFKAYNDSVQVATSYPATHSEEPIEIDVSDPALDALCINNYIHKKEETPVWVIDEGPREDFVSANPQAINNELPLSLDKLPFQYIEEVQETENTRVDLMSSLYNVRENKQKDITKIPTIAANIAQQPYLDNSNIDASVSKTGANFSSDIAMQKSASSDTEKIIKEPKLADGMSSYQSSIMGTTQKSFQPAIQLKPSLPGMELLLPPHYDLAAQQSEETLLENGIIIEEKLAEFKVKVKVIDAFAGPVITRYEIEPAQGVRGSQVVNLEKDLARSLGFASIRIVETIPGKTCMGIELPNPRRQIIRLSEIFSAPVFQQSHSKLTLALGQGITGQPIVTDLAKAPHLLVAGTTGSGKSVGVNAMILSMLFKATPDDVRMIMIDPKMLELSIYEGIPHLLAPVVTDMKLAANALTWCVNEMEKRYRLMSHTGVRNLAGFNQKIVEMAVQGRKLPNPFSLNPKDPEPLEKLPYIVVVVDEFADLMMTAGKKIEELIARLAQKARAAGIHLILATQRPSVDVITGLIKANIPTRIAFQVSSKVDSRTILDQMGAENLLGQGDMLFLPPGTAYPERVHGAFVADEEVHRVVNYLKQFGEPKYIDDILTAGVSEDDLFSNVSARNSEDDYDPLYDDAVALVVKNRKASISSVQRHLRIGYNRAARLVEQMETNGVVSAPEGNGNRTVLAPQNNQLDG